MSLLKLVIARRSRGNLRCRGQEVLKGLKGSKGIFPFRTLQTTFEPFGPFRTLVIARLGTSRGNLTKGGDPHVASLLGMTLSWVTFL